MTMFYHLLIAVGGVVGLVLVWAGVQAIVRRESPEAGDSDVLACRSCDPDRRAHCSMHEPDPEQCAAPTELS